MASFGMTTSGYRSIDCDEATLFENMPHKCHHESGQCSAFVEALLSKYHTAEYPWTSSLEGLLLVVIYFGYCDYVPT
jgi:hypothetical protein